MMPPKLAVTLGATIATKNRILAWLRQSRGTGFWDTRHWRLLSAKGIDLPEKALAYLHHRGYVADELGMKAHRLRGFAIGMHYLRFEGAKPVLHAS
jgi:hypothetical protein